MNNKWKSNNLRHYQLNRVESFYNIVINMYMTKNTVTFRSMKIDTKAKFLCNFKFSIITTDLKLKCETSQNFRLSCFSSYINGRLLKMKIGIIYLQTFSIKLKLMLSRQTDRKEVKLNQRTGFPTAHSFFLMQSSDNFLFATGHRHLVSIHCMPPHSLYNLFHSLSFHHFNLSIKFHATRNANHTL